MTQYIPKSAIVAVIETRYNECLKRAKIIDAEYWNGKADAYRDMLVVLDTFKIKEVGSKDVFIKKACYWLNKELPITDLSLSNMLDITFKVFDKECKKVFIEDFKRYMEDCL